MKKLIAIVLVTMLVLTLICCEKAPVQQSGTAAPVQSTEPSGGDPAAPADTSYNAETDADNLFSVANACLIQTEDGFYWASSTNDYLLFYDNGLEEMIPVCSRPECEHFPDNNVMTQNKNCDAYLEAVRHPALYQGKLYYVEDYGTPNPNTGGSTIGYKLFRMNPDGTEKEFLKDLFPRATVVPSGSLSTVGISTACRRKQ